MLTLFVVGFACLAITFGLMVVDVLTDFRWRGATEKAMMVVAFLGFLSLFAAFCTALISTL